jgi:hypothetical protein
MATEANAYEWSDLMGDDYTNIAMAARHRDWQGCARILFRLLFSRPAEMQQSIAVEALTEYVGIWNEKHPELRDIPTSILSHKVDQYPDVPEFPSNLDPADAEFETALIEYYNGTSRSIDHAQRTKHFATAIRSAVLARQINQWLRDFPRQFERWKDGLPLDGPSFLDDETAAKEAESAWTHLHKLMSKQHVSSRKFESEVGNLRRLAEACDDWEKSLL